MKTVGKPVLLEGDITISRPTYGDGRKLISITIGDKKSRCQVIEIQVGHAEFSEAFTGLSHIPCWFEYFSSAPIGKKREQKKELLPRPKSYHPVEEEDNEILKPYEVDGWIGSSHYLHNAHNWRTGPNGEPLVEVSFERWVDEEGETQ